MLELRYRVHRVSTHPYEVVVEHEGQKVPAQLKLLEVELTSLSTMHGTVTLRFRGAEIDEAREAFAEGEEITLSVAP